MLLATCVLVLGVAAQEPAVQATVEPPAAAAAAPADGNAPPPMYDEAAEDASRKRDVMVKRIIGWTSLGVGAVGLGLVTTSLLGLLAGSSMWVYENQSVENTGKSAGDVYKILGNGLMGSAAVLAILAAPALLVGGSLFAAFYAVNGL